LRQAGTAGNAGGEPDAGFGGGGGDPQQRQQHPPRQSRARWLEEQWMEEMSRNPDAGWGEEGES
jgi:hypothetical protein